ncbi:MAG: DoxX family protein [Candidatus Hydrogenedentota bacterium]
MVENESKNKNIGYWVATGLMCLVMAGGGALDLLRVEQMVVTMENLGYPLYLLTLLGMLKWMGVLVIVAPRFGRLKEWAYAGFTFDLTGATFSHMSVKDPFFDTITPLIVLTIVLTSWYLRPDSRKLESAIPVVDAE